MNDLLLFLGRFHVLLLHLPLGVLVLAAGMETVTRLRRFRGQDRSPFEPAMPVIWGAGALTAVATVALGYLHAREPGFVGAGVNHHRWAGTALALVAVLIWAWRADAPDSFARVWPAAVAAMLALLLVTGHLGGALTHGPDYLTEYAPGAQHADGARVASRPKVTDPQAADIYLDIVAPMLGAKCGGCHNDDKRRGGLSVVDYASLRKGGESGAVVKPGDPDASELYRRITLPQSAQDYMPKNHKRAPTAADVAVLRWWIAIGAPGSGVVRELQPPQTVSTELSRITESQGR